MEINLNMIILFILSLTTLRDIVAMTGWISFNSKFAPLVYGRYDKEIIKKCLQELGFSPSKSNEICIALEIISRENRVEDSLCEDKVNLYKLIELISKYIVCFDNYIQYGKITPTSSKYYVSTMEASKNDEDLMKMAYIISHLINTDFIKQKIDRTPDFILTPKSGNPLLGSKVAEINKYISVFRKSPEDESSSRISRKEYYKELMTNYEGTWELLEKSSKSDKKLFGVAIDCNLSGGKQIINMMEHFNNIIENEKLNIDKVKNAYVLFRADSDGEDIKEKFNAYGFTISKYFDLDENVKKLLYEYKNKSTNGNYLNMFIGEDKEKIEEIIGRLKHVNVCKMVV
ncbi:hypothetical protein [Proteiniborus sp. MB09-C3]|uniref:hypothetical protein n=1 Tax=Proteiniborus sp. MB09-C3 TaxID=3050072 RepID=UPI002552C6C1|nr:hypothetical protein [Proteiniborus sp. MB09-C3]WIV13135.1 hypothetical protein QO263_05345 [Proteiniborus sp. MB09-C3]